MKPKTCAAILFLLGVLCSLALACHLGSVYGMENVLVPLTKETGAVPSVAVDVFNPLRAWLIGGGVVAVGTGLSFLCAELYCAMLEFFRGFRRNGEISA